MRYGGVGGVRLLGCHDGERGFKSFFLSGAGAVLRVDWKGGNWNKCWRWRSIK